MIEPVSYSVSELAQRWGVTQRQILDMALQLRVPLHFNFDGLAFNAADEWHRHGGDYFVSNELTSLTTSIKNSEEWLQRHARGQTGPYDHLSDDDARNLRAEIIKNQRNAGELTDKLEARERGRRHAEYRGIVRVPPLTLLEIMEHGETDVPLKAFHSDSPIKVVQVPAREYGGAAGPAWEGAMLALEPYSRPWGKLTADSLFAMAVEVKAIEAHQKAKNSPQASTAPESAPEEGQALDTRLLATKDELISAFGPFTGMNADWFNNLKDTPGLLEARQVAGVGGRGGKPALFNPFTVMQWLIGPRNKGRPISPHKAWEMLEKHFSRVYNAHSIGDPRTD